MSPQAFRMVFVAVLLALTAGAAAFVRPVPTAPGAPPNLEALLPEEFAGWRRIALSDAVLPAETDLKPGEAVAYRAYADTLGRVVTLVVAYGPPLGDSVRLHRPETCYTAQGFEILAQGRSTISVAGQEIAIVDLDTKSPSRRESVSYWLRDGDAFTTRASDSGWTRLRHRAAQPLDGALVRVSTISADAPQFDLQRDFLTSFADSLGPDGRRTLLGEGAGS